MKTIQFLEMTKQEQTEALKHFKNAIKNRLIEYDKQHADPTLENCYISSSDLIGIYCPNSVITKINGIGNWWTFRALAKTDQGLGIALITNDDKMPEAVKKFYVNDFDFITFDELFYSKEELQTIQELNNKIKEYNDTIKVLNYIQFTTKKDGSDFLDLTKNIIKNPYSNITIYATLNEYKTSLKISVSELMTSKNGIKYNNYYDEYIYFCSESATVATVKKQIEKTLQDRAEKIAQLKNELKQIKKIFEDAKKYKNKIDALSYTTREQLKKYIF